MGLTAGTSIICHLWPSLNCFHLLCRWRHALLLSANQLLIPGAVLLLSVLLGCTARPKEQKRHSKKCAKITTQVGGLVEQYNVLLPHGSTSRLPAKLDDIKQHVYPWTAEYKRLDGEEPAGVCGGPGGWHAVLDACVHVLARSLLDSSGGHTIIEALAWITVVNLKSLHVCFTHTACYG